MIYLDDLPELEDIIDFIEPENEINNNAFDIIENCLELIDDYISNNPHAVSEPDFEETLMEDMVELLQMEMTDVEYDEFEDLVEYSLDYYFEYIGVPRSYPDSIILTPPEILKISNQLVYLKSKPQPTQRTPEWYQGRHNMITASNAYKAFETQSVQNQLIYEKCLPLREDHHHQSTCSQVNINTTLHWGQKYEPLSVMIYEYIYKTKVDDFGCIPHDKYNFIGASPDGINVDQTSERYGRMLEIKNIVNREIDGVPKKEYWIQMQMQMETCDLPECDFLETKFEEYETYEEFMNESTDKRKGVIMYYANSEGNPKYIYSPPNLSKNEEFDEWEQTTMDTIQDLTWIKNYYWKLEIMSCVLVPRNKRWFESNIQELQDIWSTILIERESGYEHRAPNKRTKPAQDTMNNVEIIESVCLIDLSGKIKID